MPSGSVPGGGIASSKALVSWRQVITLWRVIRTWRAYWLFATVFASYGLQWALARGRWVGAGARWERVHQLNAERLFRGFARLGGVYIKLGQVLSVLGSFLPEVYSRTLEQLQDSVPAKPFSDIVRRLEEGLGPDALERFQSIDREPIAAASLAQVHRGVTAQGDVVAIKVLYPGIEKLVEKDIRLLLWVARIARPLFGFGDMRAPVAQLRAMLVHETDYVRERQNIERVRAMFVDRDDLLVPRVYEQLSGRAVLVMSYESGIKVSDVDALAAHGIDRDAIAATITDCFLCMLLQHHVFHADPHPGNLLARAGNRVVLLDYGAVEDIRPELVSGLKKVMLGALSRRSSQVIEGVEEMGFVAEGGDRELLRELGEEYLARLKQINIKDFGHLSPAELRALSGLDQLRGRMRRFTSSVQYPEGYFYVERTLSLLFGVIGRLAPGKGLLGVGAPFAARALMRGYAHQGPRPQRAVP